MDNFYYVTFAVHNKEADAWTAKVQHMKKITSADDIRDAKAYYGSECSRLFGSKEFDFVSVVLSDAYGNVLEKDFVDVRVAPEPTPEPGE